MDKLLKFEFFQTGELQIAVCFAVTLRQEVEWVHAQPLEFG
jgi:hypothetical protein